MIILFSNKDRFNIPNNDVLYEYRIINEEGIELTRCSTDIEGILAARSDLSSINTNEISKISDDKKLTLEVFIENSWREIHGYMFSSTEKDPNNSSSSSNLDKDSFLVEDDRSDMNTPPTGILALDDYDIDIILPNGEMVISQNNEEEEIEEETPIQYKTLGLPSISPLNTVREITKAFIGRIPENKDLAIVNYVIAQNGIFEVRPVGSWVFTKKVSSTSYTPSVMDGEMLYDGIYSGLPPINSDILAETIKFFRDVLIKFNSEAIVRIYYSHKLNNYYIWVPKQIVKDTTVKWEVKDNEEDLETIHQNGDEWIMDIHSHADMDAFFSSGGQGTDDEDEKNDGIYGVIGNLSTSTPSMEFRIRVGTEFIEMDVFELFDFSKNAKKDFEKLISERVSTTPFFKKTVSTSLVKTPVYDNKITSLKFPFGINFANFTSNQKFKIKFATDEEMILTKEDNIDVFHKGTFPLKIAFLGKNEDNAIWVKGATGNGYSSIKSILPYYPPINMIPEPKTYPSNKPSLDTLSKNCDLALEAIPNDLKPMLDERVKMTPSDITIAIDSISKETKERLTSLINSQPC